MLCAQLPDIDFQVKVAIDIGSNFCGRVFYRHALNSMKTLFYFLPTVLSSFLFLLFLLCSAKEYESGHYFLSFKIPLGKLVQKVRKVKKNSLEGHNAAQQN